jgi:hypothetical protein
LSHRVIGSLSDFKNLSFPASIFNRSIARSLNRKII